MDARLLRYYNQELRYMRELGSEFAKEFPKIASRLGMEGLEVTDPYVERLLEGCAFLAARVQLKQDSEFPRLSHRLLELIYPNFLAPVPSMLVAQCTPVIDANLLQGHVVPRGTALMGPRTALSPTRCEFRTAQRMELTPLRTASAEYFVSVGDLGLSALPLKSRARSAVRVTLQLPEGMSLQQLTVDSLRFYLGGQLDVALQLHELTLASAVGVLVGPPGRAGDGKRQFLPPSVLRAVGYADDEAMLPNTLRGFAGTRLIQEYFAFPQRFLFLDILDLRRCFSAIAGGALEIILLFGQTGQGLDGTISAEQFALNCVPAINLFPKRADRIHVGEGHYEFHVVPDRLAPLDYEVFEVSAVQGYDEDARERNFAPLYAPQRTAGHHQTAFYTVWREPRVLSESARRDGPRSGYVGSEVFVSLVDPNDTPFPESLRQVALQLTCTNRDLPLFMGTSGAQGDFSLDTGLTMASVRAIAGPSRPHTALREGGVAWRLLNLLSLNYLSLLDTDAGEAVVALRDLLSRFPQGSDPSVRRQIEALQQVEALPVVRRHPAGGPIAFGRGIEVRLTVDELGHAGGSAFLFGAAMHHYLSRHVSLNSFVETVLVSPDARRDHAVETRQRQAARVVNMSSNPTEDMQAIPDTRMNLAGPTTASRANAYEAWLQRAMEAPHRQDFYQLLRHIESAHPHLPRLGEALRPGDEPVRVAQPAELTFAPAPIHQIVAGSGGTPRVMQRIFGLLGPNGPLPIHLTELTRDRALHHADPVLQRFLDTLTHRFALQFYRAWSMAQPVNSLDRPGDTSFARRIGSLFGIGSETLTGRDALGDAPKLYMAGRLARHVRDADGLVNWCRATFDVPVEVQQWCGHWMPLARDERTRLLRRGEHGLGRGAVLGETVWDVQHKFRIVVGPMGLARYRDFLPGGHDLERLLALVRQWAGLEFTWDLLVILKREEVPPLRLRRGEVGASLGRTSWLGHYRRPSDPRDMIIDAEGTLGRRRTRPTAAPSPPQGLHAH